MNILTLIIYTLLAWLVHVGLYSVYSRWFSSTKSVLFRLAHSLEVGITVAVMLSFYSQNISMPTILATILGTLLVVDGVLYASIKNIRQKFDALHFIAAYTVVALTVIIV
jgi:hypothetical protein